MKADQALYTAATMGAILLGTLSSTANAKERREGVNFGIGLKIFDETSFDPASSQSEADGKRTSSSKHLSPYFAYAFGKHLNLGLSFLFENQENQDRFKITGSNQELQSSRSTSIRAGSLFARYMFAGFMYFEGGFGAYEVRESRETTVKVTGSDGAFSGSNESNSRQGVGPGYHLAVGAELSITNGFFFSGSYNYRSFTSFSKDGEQVGPKKSTIDKKELIFGLTYYQG